MRCGVRARQADLLPAGSDEAAVAAWLQNTAFHKKLNPIATFLVSSRTGMRCSFSTVDCCKSSSLSLTCIPVSKPVL